MQRMTCLGLQEQGKMCPLKTIKLKYWRQCCLKRPKTNRKYS